MYYIISLLIIVKYLYFEELLYFDFLWILTAKAEVAFAVGFLWTNLKLNVLISGYTKLYMFD